MTFSTSTISSIDFVHSAGFPDYTEGLRDTGSPGPYQASYPNLGFAAVVYFPTESSRLLEKFELVNYGTSEKNSSSLFEPVRDAYGVLESSYLESSYDVIRSAPFKRKILFSGIASFASGKLIRRGPTVVPDNDRFVDE